jgi:hypothetical protein
MTRQAAPSAQSADFHEVRLPVRQSQGPPTQSQDWDE